uniref:Hypothetical_protein n=1 Tax=Oryza glaberrima TaxID=4538 RepID=G2XLJ7_ORYGL|nr:hypothetical_protein [Oryza glaberrima]
MVSASSLLLPSSVRDFASCIGDGAACTAPSSTRTRRGSAAVQAQPSTLSVTASYRVALASSSSPPLQLRLTWAHSPLGPTLSFSPSASGRKVLVRRRRGSCSVPSSGEDEAVESESELSASSPRLALFWDLTAARPGGVAGAGVRVLRGGGRGKRGGGARVGRPGGGVRQGQVRGDDTDPHGGAVRARGARGGGGVVGRGGGGDAHRARPVRGGRGGARGERGVRAWRRRRRRRGRAVGEHRREARGAGAAAPVELQGEPDGVRRRRARGRDVGPPRVVVPARAAGAGLRGGDAPGEERAREPPMAGGGGRRAGLLPPRRGLQVPTLTSPSSSSSTASSLPHLMMEFTKPSNQICVL